MPTTVRRSVVRTYTAIAAGHHKRNVREQRQVTSKMATEIIKAEPWGPSKSSYLASVATAGTHLLVEYPLRQKWHRDRLIRVATGLAFKFMDAYISTVSQEEGMIPTVANYISDILRSKDFTFVSNELDKAVDLDDRLDEEELEYIMAMVSIVKILARQGKDITLESVSKEARKRLIQMAEENVTVEFASGGGLRQVEYREELSCLCLRNIETDEIRVEKKREYKRDSNRFVREVAATPEGSSISIGSISDVKEVFMITEKEVKTMTTQHEVRSAWTPVKYLSDIDASSAQCTARVWYLLLNHTLPNKFSFRPGPFSWALRPASGGFSPTQLISVDTEVSKSEMKCSPLQLQASIDRRGREWIHPIGTTLREAYGGPTIKWDGETSIEDLTL